VATDYKIWFQRATEEARKWGDVHLTWLSLTVREVAEEMLKRSIRQRLSEVGIPTWASEAFTMDSLVELWLPHREALRSTSELPKGILSDQRRICLINMPTSAGKSNCK
jgi:hypothetical protein